jgi:hypothetical protein
MKTILLFILLFCGSVSFSQEINWEEFDKIKIKIVNEDGTTEKTVRSGDFCSFKIKNINKFLYRITISGKKIDLETPVPTELQALFRLSPSQLAGSASNKKVEEAISSTNVEKQKISLLKGLRKTTRKNFNSNQDFQSALNDLIDKCDAYIRKAKEISNTIFELKLLKVKLVVMAQKDISAAQMKTEIATINIPSTDPSTNYIQLLNLYADLQTAYKFVLDKAVNEEKVEVKMVFDKIEKAFVTIDEEQLLLQYSDVIYLYGELQNDKNFIAIAPPVQADGDFINYKVTIDPAYTSALGAHKNPVAFDFDVPVKCGWKVDFSVGPVFSFGNGAKDEKYFLENSITENKSILKKRENNNNISPGIAAMMHFYRRSGTEVSWGGLLGAGAGFQNIDDAEVSFYTGLSLVLGKKQKIMINGGISFLSVERLKTEQYETDKEYLTSGINLVDVTEKVFKGSFFLSLSYNLTNRVER